MMSLDQPITDFLAAKRERLCAQRQDMPSGSALKVLRQRAAGLPRPRPFAEALAGGANMAVIAEFKRRSPSAGPLAHGEGPTSAALAYEAAGARALSILTDSEDFGGTMDDLEAAAEAVALPVLCKDFILDEARLCEARLAGAAAALLIVGMLTENELRSLMAAAEAIALETLVEVHDAAELALALECGAKLIGINNRNLRTLRTDLRMTSLLAPQAPQGICIVSESGIRSADDVRAVRDAGAHAVLVGESLLRLEPGRRCEHLMDLAGVPR